MYYPYLELNYIINLLCYLIKSNNKIFFNNPGIEKYNHNVINKKLFLF